MDVKNLLASCTARVTGDQIDTGFVVGTGFFVGPGQLLTCAHVVAGKNGKHVKNPRIEWENTQITARLEAEDYYPSPDLDIAILTIPIDTNPYVMLGKTDISSDIGNQVVSYVYPASRDNGEYATFEIEGIATNDAFLKLKLGQAVPGMSGAPVLNVVTGAVCGMLTLTRDKFSDLGARHTESRNLANVSKD